MASGIGGGVGICAPSGRKPFSSATYRTEIGVPSGAVYEYEPLTVSASALVPGFFKYPLSWAAFPSAVVKL